MIVNKTGKYKTNREYSGFNLTSVWTIPKGTEFTVSQINNDNRRFWASIFGCWTNWDKDVTFIEENL